MPRTPLSLVPLSPETTLGLSPTVRCLGLVAGEGYQLSSATGYERSSREPIPAISGRFWLSETTWVCRH